MGERGAVRRLIAKVLNIVHISFGCLPSFIPVQQRLHLAQLVEMVELAAAAKKEKNGKGETIEVKFVRI